MAPPAGVNGILPASVLAKKEPPKKEPQTATRGQKAPQPRLKLVLRRLPPGLTETEFKTILGDEWKQGAGKVDWLLYKKGKISKEYVRDAQVRLLELRPDSITAQPSPHVPLGPTFMSRRRRMFLSSVIMSARLPLSTKPSLARTVLSLVPRPSNTHPTTACREAGPSATPVKAPSTRTRNLRIFWRVSLTLSPNRLRPRVMVKRRARSRQHL